MELVLLPQFQDLIHGNGAGVLTTTPRFNPHNGAGVITTIPRFNPQVMELV